MRPNDLSESVQPSQEDIKFFADYVYDEIDERWMNGKSLPLDMSIIRRARELSGFDLLGSKRIHDILIEQHRDDLTIMGYTLLGPFCLSPPIHPSGDYSFS